VKSSRNCDSTFLNRKIRTALATGALTVFGLFGMPMGAANAAVTQSTEPPYIPIACAPTNPWGVTWVYVEGTQLCESNFNGYDYTEACYGPDLWPKVPASKNTLEV
jgi:hypothetical protein